MLVSCPQITYFGCIAYIINLYCMSFVNLIPYGVYVHEWKKIDASILIFFICIKYLFDNADDFMHSDMFFSTIRSVITSYKTNKGWGKTQNISSRPALSESCRWSFIILSKSHTYRSVRLGLRCLLTMLRSRSSKWFKSSFLALEPLGRQNGFDESFSRFLRL